MRKTDVTVGVLNYKTPEFLQKSLASIFKYTKGLQFEVCVVDNGSKDESVNLVRTNFSKVKLIVNSQNLFATVGYNQILKSAEGRYCLVMNADIEFLGNVVKSLLSFLKRNKDISAVSCRQITPDGKTDNTCSRFPTPIIEFFESCLFARFFRNEKLIGWYRYSGWSRKNNRKVDVIPDTILLARTEVLAKIGFYDEGMDLFFMENDLCLRLKRAGFSVWHLGTTGVLHHRGASTLKFTPKQMYKFYEHDMLYYYKKHFGFWWWLFLKTVFYSNSMYYLFWPAWLLIRRKILK